MTTRRTVENERMRAAIYTRISSDSGTALGIARQEQDCRALAVQRGWTIVDVYGATVYESHPR
jgi:site-specific DNA recombinase